ncbi:glycosyltransferase [Rubrivivax sp. JA1024]|nr:glycosyltransferase [Rubrivivax sp. JA1024]
MHILLLSCDHPSFAHGSPNSLVLAALIEGLVEAGDKVSWAVCEPPTPLSDRDHERLTALGVSFAGDYTKDFQQEAHGWRRRWDILNQAIGIAPTAPAFSDPRSVTSRLEASGADVAVLFWDGWFEHLLGHFKSLPVVGYLAKPRYDAPKVRLRSGLTSPRLQNPVRKLVAERMLADQEKRHLARIRELRAIAEICDLDRARYGAQGVPSRYVPIAFPDVFGERSAFQRHADQRTILGGMGTLHATGSRIGLEFFAREVYPHLIRQLADHDWCINFYGRGQIPIPLQQIADAPHIRLRGFVDDIEGEILDNDVFLFCNNAGPYEGAYTRVALAFCAGRCLVGHTKLSASMLEVENGKNALLGSSGAEIANLTTAALRDPELRRRVGSAARETYQTRFAPARVAGELRSLIREQCE